MPILSDCRSFARFDERTLDGRTFGERAASAAISLNRRYGLFEVRLGQHREFFCALIPR
jgi:hypothetical protein